MDSKSDWYYGQKTKHLLSKGKKNEGNINALIGLKISIDTDTVDDNVDTLPSTSNISYPAIEDETVVLKISANNNLNDTQHDEKELDMDENDYEKLKSEFLMNKIIKNSNEIKLIEKSTTLQSECELWHKERRIRLTASNFVTICKL